MQAAPRLRGREPAHKKALRRDDHPSPTASAAFRLLPNIDTYTTSGPIPAVLLNAARFVDGHGQTPSAMRRSRVALARTRNLVVDSPPRRHSSVVEQLFRKQQVLGSNPSVGSTSSDQNRSARAGSFTGLHVHPADPLHHLLHDPMLNLQTDPLCVDARSVMVLRRPQALGSSPSVGSNTRSPCGRAWRAPQRVVVPLGDDRRPGRPRRAPAQGEASRGFRATRQDVRAPTGMTNTPSDRRYA